MAATWLEEEMVGLDLCDARLNLRCHERLSDLAARPNASIPEAVGGGNAEVQAADRFWANENVSAEAILAPHIAASRRRIAEHPSVVLVQDTTEIDVTRPAQEVAGAGPLDEGSRVGGFAHPRVSRTTVVQVRAARVTLRGPHRPTGRLPDVTVSAVLVREITPPAGEAPIEWLLITTLPITTLEQVQRVIKLDAVRWKIELFFRMLKQGGRVEERRFEFQDRVERFLAMSLIIAWRISDLCHLGRECPEMRCEAVFSPEEWQVAYRVVSREKPPRTPLSLQAMIRIVAQLGGDVNRVREDEPGLQTLWRGMQRLNDLTLSWKLCSLEAKNSG